MNRLYCIVWCWLLGALASPAHEVRPAYLELMERRPGEFDVFWKVPAKGGVPLAGEEPAPEPSAPPRDSEPLTMPCGCPVPTPAQLARGVLPIHPSLPKDVRVIRPPRVERMPGSEIRRWTIQAGPTGLNHGEFSVHGLSATMTDVLVRIAFADGRVVSRMLHPDAPTWVLHPDDLGPPAAGYLRLGIEHILLGIDHLLFVLCLLFLVRGPAAILKTVTAFTLAHSLTLALASLELVRLSPAPVEAVIALSIVFLASEVAKRTRGAGEPGLAQRKPWWVAFVFGLLHGFGFAGALGEIGLPANDIPLALLLFNLGVEVGQLVFIALALMVGKALAVFARQWPKWVHATPSYGVGTVASYWLISRILAIG